MVGLTLLVVVAEFEQVVNVLLSERLLNNDGFALRGVLVLPLCAG